MSKICLLLLLILIGCSNAFAQINTGGGTSSGPAPPGTINPVTYGALFNVSVVPDGSTSNSTNIVTCPNADCKFQTGTHPAVVGMIFFANAGTGSACLDNAPITFGGANQTTITSVDSDTQIHVSGTGNTTTTATACMAWGNDDTSAINAAWAAGGCTASIWMPIGKSFISAPVFQAIAGCPAVSQSGTGYQGQRVWGGSVVGTYLIPVPNFNFSSITGGCGLTTAGTSCTAAIGNPNIADYENFNVWGLGTRCTATLANTTLWDVGISTRAINVNGIGWCGRGGGTTLIGFSINGGTDIYEYGGSNFFGSVLMNFNQSPIFFGNSFISGGTVTTLGQCNVMSQAGSVVNSIGNVIVGCLQHAGVWTSQSSQFQGQDLGGTSCIFVGTNAVLNLLSNDQVCVINVTNQPGITFFGTGGIVRLSGSTVNANGTGFSLLGVANNTFVNQGGNSFSGGAGVWNSVGTAFAYAGESGTVSCTTSAATITFKDVYKAAPIVVIQDRTTAGAVTQTSINATTEVVGCPGASDVLNYTVTPNPF